LTAFEPSDPRIALELRLGRSLAQVDTLRVPSVLEALVTALERPRELPGQVVNHLSGVYGIEREAVGTFLVNELPKLEDYEIDLILSPIFTPALLDQAVFADLLGQDSIPASQWPSLIQQLAARPTIAHLLTADSRTHSVPLREVALERYVHRLRLDATIPEPLFNLLTHLPPAADRPLLKAIARRAVWQNEARRSILQRHLTAVAGSDSYRLDDLVELLKLMEIYQPADSADLFARLPHWQQLLRHEINSASIPKPFFNERVQELHGGGRDQRRQDDSRLTAKEQELAFLTRLQQILAG
jgi:hypothetical protein